MTQRRFKQTFDYGPHSRGGVQKASRLAKMYPSLRQAPVPRPRSVFSVTERKYFDSHLNASALASPTTWAGTELDPATLNTLFAPTQGSDINNRIGRKVAVMKITMRGVIRAPAQTNETATDDYSCCRLILYMDQQTNGAQAQGENLMANPGAASGILNVMTYQNTANFGRFRVLKDKFINLGNPAISWDGTNMEQQGVSRTFKFTVKFRKPVIIQFNATNGGTVADIVDNSFHLIGATTSTGIAPAVSYQCRVVYTDA